MGLESYRNLDKKISTYVYAVPVLWTLLWIYQEFRVLDNSFFLAQSASFIFIVMLPLAYYYHYLTVKKLYAKHMNKDFKDHLARHRVRLYGLSLVVPIIVFAIYFGVIFRHSLEQNIVYGSMLIMVTGTLQLSFINMFSQFMYAPASHDPLPNVLTTLLAYPVIAMPVFQSLIYFTLI